MAKVSERFDLLGSDGAPVRLGIMGGTFDPIHLGHLRVAEEMREELGLQAVLFIPAGDPVFKRDQHVTDARVRLEQVRAAVSDNPFFDVSPVEVDREGGTYTVDTLRQLREHYPENVQFFLILGSDAAEGIVKWRGCAEIAELAHLAVAVGRPGSANAEVLKDVISKAAPFDMHLVRVSALEISSRGIRERIAQGKSIRYLLPASSACSACALQQGAALPDEGAPADAGQASAGPAGPSAGSEGGEGPAVAEGEPAAQAPLKGAADSEDVLSKAFFKERKAELKDRVGPKRFEHSLNVSDTCVRLAKRYGLDVKKARLAGLLHDWDKGMDDEQARQRVRELGMESEIDPYVVQNMPRVLHGMTAARALERDFPGIPADVLQAISRHTVAAEDMSELDMALYVADAIEPGRHFGKIDELRDSVDEVDLPELYRRTYEYWVFLLFERGRTLHPDTIRIWNSIVCDREREKRSAGNASGSHPKGE